MIAIVDYGMGNLRSVANAIKKLDGDFVITKKKDVIKDSTAVVLPGVGAFGKCIENLKKLELFDMLKDLILNDKRYLGICLGMQVLFDASEEAPGISGMGIIKGNVAKFKGDVKVPHMGWNSIEVQKDNPIFNGIKSGEHFYFVHSYHVAPEDESCAAGRCSYGYEFVCAVEKENIMGTQFHPEKSSKRGLQILKNFGEMVNC